MYSFTNKIAVAFLLCVAIACGILPEGDEQRGYRFFIESILSSAPPDGEEEDFGIVSAIDLIDCQPSETEPFDQVIVSSGGSANLVVEVLPSFSFDNGLLLQLTHYVVDFIPVESIDRDDANAIINPVTTIVQFSDNSGFALNVGTNDDANLGVNITIMTSRQKTEFIESLFDLGYAFGTTTGTVAIAMDETRYRLHFEIWAEDNYGNTVSATSEAIVTIADYNDEDCSN